MRRKTRKWPLAGRNKFVVVEFESTGLEAVPTEEHTRHNRSGTEGSRGGYSHPDDLAELLGEQPLASDDSARQHFRP